MSSCSKPPVDSPFVFSKSGIKNTKVSKPRGVFEVVHIDNQKYAVIFLFCCHQTENSKSKNSQVIPVSQGLASFFLRRVKQYIRQALKSLSPSNCPALLLEYKQPWSMHKSVGMAVFTIKLHFQRQVVASFDLWAIVCQPLLSPRSLRINLQSPTDYSLRNSAMCCSFCPVTAILSILSSRGLKIN